MEYQFEATTNGWRVYWGVDPQVKEVETPRCNQAEVQAKLPKPAVTEEPLDVVTIA